MTDRNVEQAVAQAVQRAYDRWAVEHPSLARVIDRVTVAEQTAESLRKSEAYRRAVAAYHRGRNELELIHQLTDLAVPLVERLLTG
ncbi:MAG: hypothetical protein ACP5HU_11030 [Phycisphaerae bacterium]